MFIRVNIEEYLCKVDEVPELKDIKGIMCQAYKIIEWYPVYPVIRDPTVLPSVSNNY